MKKKWKWEPADYAVIVFALMAMTLGLLVWFFPGDSIDTKIEVPARKLPLGYNYEFVEIEGTDCVLVTKFIYFAIDCDWRK